MRYLIVPGRAVRGRQVRPTLLTGVVASLAVIITLLIVVLPGVRFAYRSSEVHLVLETVAAMVGGLVALLVYGRFRRSGALQELLLAYALALLAVAALLFVAVPDALGAAPDSVLTTWAPLMIRLVGGVLLFVAAAVPGRRVSRPDLAPREVVLVALLLLSVAVAAMALEGRFPPAVRQPPDPEQSGHPVIEGHAGVLLAQLLLLGCFTGAAVLFTRQAERYPEDPLLRWVGAGAALGAVARVNYLLFPSLYSEWIYTGDLFRLGFYGLLLVGAVREITAYWATQAEAAASAERQRLARELHDGAVQELGYIWSQSKILARRPNPATADQIRAAAERALDETRRAVAALAAPVDEPLSDTLRRATCDVGDRYDVALTMHLDEIVTVPASHREALVRIAREAVANAARHGGASVVEVRLRPHELVVRDDGSGFDAKGNGRAGGFGLQSMRDRAEGIGGALVIDSQAGRGTTVRVTW